MTQQDYESICDTQRRLEQTNIWIARHKTDEYKRLCKKVGESFVKVFITKYLVYDSETGAYMPSEMYYDKYGWVGQSN